MNTRLYGNKKYIILLLGQVISELGNSLTQVALAWFIYTTTKSTLYLGTFLSIQFTFSTISRLFVGILLDKYNKKTLIIFSEIIRGTVMIFIPLLFHYNILSLWTLFGLAAILGVSSVIFEPALDIIIPVIVSREDIMKANSVLASLSQLLMILGPIVAGILISTLGASVSILIDGVTFYVSAITIYLIKVDTEPEKKRIEDEPSHNIFQFIAESLDTFKEYKILITLLLKFCIINIGLAPIYVLIPIFTDTVLNLDAKAIGVLFSALSFGMLVGSLLPGYFKQISKLKVLTIMSGTLTIALGFSILGFSHNLFQSVIGIFLIGLSITPIQIVNSTIWQILVKTEVKGRVFALRRLITRSLDPISIMIFSIVLDFTGVSIVFFAISLLILSTFAWSLVTGNLKKLDSILEPFEVPEGN